VRARIVEQEFEGEVELDWRSFLLRPRAEPGRSLEKFRAYTEGWQRAAAQPDSGTFRTWSSDEGPPSHSIPPHLVAKAAARLGRDAFERVHERLLSAYFRDSRDITTPANLRAIWQDAGLPDARLADADDPELLRQVIDEHNEAVGLGAGGVPAFRLEGVDAVITGAHPTELFRRWLRRALEAREA
jgi:predicted DsbA family dithiol-disulfide isomerase